MDNTVTVRSDSVLLLIDVQEAFNDPILGRRDNPDAEANIARIVERWVATGRPIVRVRHENTKPGSLFAPDGPGYAFQPVAADLDPALDLVKNVHSAFYGTPDLHAWLTERAAGQVVIAGIQTNFCCETTARMAGNLGYDVLFAYDATYTFDEVSPDGITRAGGAARARHPDQPAPCLRPLRDSRPASRRLLRYRKQCRP